MRRRGDLEQAGACSAPLQACDRSVGRPLGAWQYLRPEELPEKRPHHPPVRDEDDVRSVPMAGADGREGLFEPRDNLLVGLRADERPAFLLWDREELLCQLGVMLLLFGPGVAFQDTPVPLAQAVGWDDLALESRTVADYLCGLESAGEWARVEALERFVREAASRKAHLPPALFRERKIHLALPDTFRVCRGLSMTHQE